MAKWSLTIYSQHKENNFKMFTHKTRLRFHRHRKIIGKRENKVKYRDHDQKQYTRIHQLHQE
jgi:predicted amino acid dehydrogenase